MTDIFATDTAFNRAAARTLAFRDAFAHIETSDDLENFLAQLFEDRGIENAAVNVSGDRDSFDIEVEGVGVNDDNVICNPLRTFDVQVTLTLTRTFEVEGFTEEEAQESFEFGGDNYDAIADAFGWEWEQERCEVEVSDRW